MPDWTLQPPLPPAQLDELSTPRHKGERQPRLNEEEASRGQEEEEEEEVPGREDSVDEVQLNGTQTHMHTHTHAQLVMVAWSWSCS